MERRTLWLAAAGAFALCALALASAPPAAAATVYVNATGNLFVPQNVTVQVGDTVNWTNLDAGSHDVTFEAGGGSGPGAIGAGASFEFTFTATGQFAYRCSIHTIDFTGAMVGRVTVLDTAGGPSSRFTSAPAGPFGTSALVNFSGLSTDNASVVEVFWQVDNGTVSTGLPQEVVPGDARVARWAFTLNTAGLLEGNHTLSVWAFNGTGNGTAATHPFRVQAVAVTPVSLPYTWTIEMRNFLFSPNALTIATGDTVIFVNREAAGHDVRFETGETSGAVGALGLDASWSVSFSTPGTYRFRCQAHTTDFNGAMSGTLTVYDRSLRPAAALSPAPPTAAAPGAVVALAGNASDNAGVTGVFISVDGGAPVALNFTPVVAGDLRFVTWAYNLTFPAPGSHTFTVFSSNGVHNSTPVTYTISIQPPGAGPGGVPGNPFGETFVFEDIMSKYFWLIVGVSVILLAVVMMFLSYSGKLQNYYIALLTALDERMRLFAFTRPTREFLYTIQRQMPRTHTERYNLKVIWYWYPLYCLGGLSFAAFIILTITGIILGFYYIPEGTGPNENLPSAAYQSMEVIMTKVTFGYIFRALHHWGAHMMVAAVFLHMMRVYFVGAYKNPRELNWLLGVILLNVTLLFGYTGYLLPWDQLSFWAGQIGLEMAYTVPVIGEIIGNMLFGGPELSGATIIRMYYLHVFVLPLVGGALMVLHMGIVWMQGVAEPH